MPWVCISPLLWQLSQGFCVIPALRTVLQKKEHSCSSLLLTPSELELGMRVRGSEPGTLRDVKEMEWEPSTTLYFTLPEGATEALRSGQDTSAPFQPIPLLAPGPWEIIQCGSHPFGRAEDKAQPASAHRGWREGWLRWPIGPKITLELCESHNSGQGLKTCPFSNVNNIKRFQ